MSRRVGRCTAGGGGVHELTQRNNQDWADTPKEVRNRKLEAWREQLLLAQTDEVLEDITEYKDIIKKARQQDKGTFKGISDHPWLPLYFACARGEVRKTEGKIGMHVRTGARSDLFYVHEHKSQSIKWTKKIDKRVVRWYIDSMGEKVKRTEQLWNQIGADNRHGIMMEYTKMKGNKWESTLKTELEYYAKTRANYWTEHPSRRPSGMKKDIGYSAMLVIARKEDLTIEDTRSYVCSSGITNQKDAMRAWIAGKIGDDSKLVVTDGASRRVLICVPHWLFVEIEKVLNVCGRLLIPQIEGFKQATPCNGMHTNKCGKALQMGAGGQLNVAEAIDMAWRNQVNLDLTEGGQPWTLDLTGTGKKLVAWIRKAVKDILDSTPKGKLTKDQKDAIAMDTARRIGVIEAIWHGDFVQVWQPVTKSIGGKKKKNGYEWKWEKTAETGTHLAYLQFNNKRKDGKVYSGRIGDTEGLKKRFKSSLTLAIYRGAVNKGPEWGAVITRRQTMKSMRAFVGDTLRLDDKLVDTDSEDDESNYSQAIETEGRAPPGATRRTWGASDGSFRTLPITQAERDVVVAMVYRAETGSTRTPTTEEARAAIDEVIGRRPQPAEAPIPDGARERNWSVGAAIEGGEEYAITTTPLTNSERDRLFDIEQASNHLPTEEEVRATVAQIIADRTPPADQPGTQTQGEATYSFWVRGVDGGDNYTIEIQDLTPTERPILLEGGLQTEEEIRRRVTQIIAARTGQPTAATPRTWTGDRGQEDYVSVPLTGEEYSRVERLAIDYYDDRTDHNGDEGFSNDDLQRAVDFVIAERQRPRQVPPTPAGEQLRTGLTVVMPGGGRYAVETPLTRGEFSIMYGRLGLLGDRTIEEITTQVDRVVAERTTTPAPAQDTDRPDPTPTGGLLHTPSGQEATSGNLHRGYWSMSRDGRIQLPPISRDEWATLTERLPSDDTLPRDRIDTAVQVIIAERVATPDTVTHDDGPHTELEPITEHRARSARWDRTLQTSDSGGVDERLSGNEHATVLRFLGGPTTEVELRRICSHVRYQDCTVVDIRGRRVMRQFGAARDRGGPREEPLTFDEWIVAHRRLPRSQERTADQVRTICEEVRSGTAAVEEETQDEVPEPTGEARALRRVHYTITDGLGYVEERMTTDEWNQAVLSLGIGRTTEQDARTAIDNALGDTNR